jgi:hypothetical protein
LSCGTFGPDNITGCDCIGIPEEFQFESSTQQAFYYFQSVTIDGDNVDADDWVGAFNGNVCVGARKWDISLCNGGVCDVPVLGDDATACNFGEVGDCEYELSCGTFGPEEITGCDCIGIPEEFQFVSSTQSAYYYLHSVTIDGVLVESDDWVGAFNGNTCVGARQWDTSLCSGGICDVPIMGLDGFLPEETEGYMESGDIPIMGTSHIPPEHREVSHCLAPTQVLPLKAPTQSSDSTRTPSIVTECK